MFSAIAARLASVRAAAGGSTNNIGSGATGAPIDDVPVAALSELRKRQHEFAYLRGCLGGEIFAFNAALLGCADVEAASVSGGCSDLTPLWYRCLLSLGRLLTSLGKPDQADTLLRAACQLMAEVEHAAGDTVIPDTLLALASVGGANDTFPDSVRVRPGEPVKASLHTVRKGVVYEILLPAGAAPLPFDGLSFRETALSLLAALYDVYDRLVSHPRATDAVPNFAEATGKMDARVRRHFIKPISDCIVRACAIVSRRALLGVPTLPKSAPLIMESASPASEALVATSAAYGIGSGDSRKTPQAAIPLMASLHELSTILTESAASAAATATATAVTTSSIS